MNPREKGFLLLTSQLGNPERKPLSVAQFRTLAARAREMKAPMDNRHMRLSDLTELGYSEEMARRILQLLSHRELLEHYLHKAKIVDCIPITRVSEGYPSAIRKKLGEDSPGCLWYKGDAAILRTPCVALVGSRDLCPGNRQFAREVGRQAALQGYTLVSGNARGADTVAQEACLEAGGSVISVVADKLESHSACERVLYLAEEDFDASFSAMKALSRNRVIHCLGQKTFVAQVTAYTGGTWNGTQRNLLAGWSSVLCYDDGSEGMEALAQMGAARVTTRQLGDIAALESPEGSLFRY